jgi:hypothetical protein
MAAWTRDQLDRIASADELNVASLRRDGMLGDSRTIWVVRVGDDLYVRSVNGRTSGWFRGTQVRREGRIRAGGVEQDVSFVQVDDSDLADRIDDEYRTKYERYAANIVGHTVTAEARSATLKLVPRP